MANEDIRIVIKKGESGEGTAPTTQSQVATAQTGKKEAGKTNVQQDAINAALIQVGKQMIMTTAQKFGDLTGNYAAVRTMNQVMSFGADALTIYATGGVGAIFVAGKYAVQAVTRELDHFRNVQEHEFNVQRLGTISTKGSRY